MIDSATTKVESNPFKFSQPQKFCVGMLESEQKTHVWRSEINKNKSQNNSQADVARGASTVD